MSKKAVVIGAGIGGMASAIRLAHLGFETSVYESNAEPGGKVNSKHFGSYRFDMGPSVFTEPHLVDELLSINGVSSCDFEYQKLSISCNYFFEDGTKVALPHGPERVADVLHKDLGEDKNKVLRFLNKLRRNYEAVYPVFISASLHRFTQWMNVGIFRAISRIPKYGLLRSMDAVNRAQFKNPKTAQIFNRFATYNGSNPYEAPGMLNIIAHLELNIGPYIPKGGMVSISNHLFEQAKSMGVKFYFKQAVNEILHNNKRIEGVRIANQKIDADVVISNMDVHNTYKKLLNGFDGPQKILSQEKSSSAIVFYWGIKKKFPGLDVHNIFFSNEYENEFQKMFKEHGLSDDPTIYIHISSKVEKQDAPEYGENWFVMVNAPINKGQDWEIMRKQLRQNILLKLSRILKEDIESLIEIEEYTDPSRLEQMYSGMHGSIYGNSSNSKMSAFYRHPNFSNQLKGLYFSGVTVHPGGGIPLAINSAKIIEKCLKRDFNLV